MPRKSAGGREGAVGLVEDEDREGDDPHPVAELVDRVGEGQPAEGRAAQRRSEAADLPHCGPTPVGYRDFCTSFPADAQVLRELWYKTSKLLTSFSLQCAI